MLIAALALLPFAIKALYKLKSGRNLLLLTLVGFAGNFFPAFLFTYAETGLSSGYAGMLNSFVPIFALIIGFVVFKNKLTTLQVSGIAIGTVGIILLTLSGADLSLSGSWTHVGAILIATLCYAISVNTIKYTLQHLSGLEITSLSFMLTIVPSIIINLYSGTLETIQTNEYAYQGLGFIIILSVVGTAFAVVLFNILISNSSVLFASSVTYLIPVVAVIIGLSFNEHINIYQIGSMAVVLTGVFVANILGRKKLRQ
ncbi:MAG: drug/metabolite transporter (DMT)-like permease [Crocinitomicaceae bacterium]|jgi:drug/metabolite transporter (DMT)-like permease